MKERDVHAAVDELVPWFVNGTLSEEEATLVERHMRECLTCYAAIQRERRVRALVRESSAVPLSPERGFEKLMSGIDGGRRGHSASAFGRKQRLLRRPAAVAALGLAAGILVVMAGTFVWNGIGSGPVSGERAFETLTEPAAEARAPRLDIVFQDALSESETRDVLREIGATIVAGPTELGRYTVELDASLEDEALNALIERLRRDDRVVFVGRSFTSEGER